MATDKTDRTSDRIPGASHLQPNEDVTPVFGLTKAQLRPIVDNIAREPVVSFDVRN